MMSSNTVNHWFFCPCFVCDKLVLLSNSHHITIGTPIASITITLSKGSLFGTTWRFNNNNQMNLKVVHSELFVSNSFINKLDSNGIQTTNNALGCFETFIILFNIFVSVCVLFHNKSKTLLHFTSNVNLIERHFPCYFQRDGINYRKASPLVAACAKRTLIACWVSRSNRVSVIQSLATFLDAPCSKFAYRNACVKLPRSTQYLQNSKTKTKIFHEMSTLVNIL